MDGDLALLIAATFACIAAAAVNWRNLGALVTRWFRGR